MLSKYKPEYAELLIDHLTEGKSIESFPAFLFRETGVRIGRQSIYDWIKAHEDFAAAHEFAKSMSFSWWEERGMDALTDAPGFNTTMWIFSMKARFKHGVESKQATDEETEESGINITKGPDA